MILERDWTSSHRKRRSHSSSLCLVVIAILLGGCGSLPSRSRTTQGRLDVDQVRAAVPVGTAAEDVDKLLSSHGIKQPVHMQASVYGVQSGEALKGDFLVLSHRSRSGLLVEWVQIVALQLDANGRVSDYLTGGYGYGP
jgi:hypothetical protein